MEKLKWTTPIKNGNEYENLTIKSPVIYKTPVKQCETNSKRTTYQSNISSFSVLPNHITPPSGLTKFMARNPFETDLTSRLHLSVISPTVFSKVSSPSQQSSNFEWSVDELALIQPAKIEEFPIQQIHCIDTETEIKAQAAIDQFFNENEIIPSPWETKRKEIRTKIEVNTPVRSSPDLNLDSSNSKKDGWSQTMLTFAPELPSHVMEILKPYFTFVQNQNIESDDANSSNNSLRRKLFFNHEDCVDNDESSICVSPVKMNGSLLLSSSPPQSGMLIHGAPLKYSSNEDCHYDISQINTENLSPPNISPIHNAIIHMSGENVRSHSTTQLNFTMNMSIDEPNNQHKELLDHSLDKSINKKNVGRKVEFLNVHNNSTCDTRIEKKILAKNSIYNVEHNCDNKTSEFNFKCQNTDNTLKYVTDSCKMNTNDSIFQQTNAMLATSNQQSVSNSAQDTGYQTYSMNNTTNVTDSYDITPIKQKLCWGDQILITDDEFPLSDWKENMKNIFSSTPSRTNREKDNHVF